MWNVIGPPAPRHLVHQLPLTPHSGWTDSGSMAGESGPHDTVCTAGDRKLLLHHCDSGRTVTCGRALPGVKLSPDCSDTIQSIDDEIESSDATWQCDEPARPGYQDTRDRSLAYPLAADCTFSSSSPAGQIARGVVSQLHGGVCLRCSGPLVGCTMPAACIRIT